MRFSMTLAALALAAAPALATAQESVDDNSSAPQTSAPTPTAAGDGAPAAEFTTFQPTPFESRLFKDPHKITQIEGEDIYRALCAGCHMPDAKGAVGAGMYPALAGNENLIVGDYPVSVIVNGLHGMPPFRQVLDDQQILAVVEYLQGTLEDTEVFPATLETVQAAREAAGPLPK